MSGYLSCVLMTLPMASLPFSLAASLTPKRSAYITSAPLSIIAKAASLAFGGSNQQLMKVTMNSTFGLTSFAPAMKAFIRRFTSGIGIAADHADLVDLGHAAGDHAGQVGRLLDVVVEDREVGLLRLARAAHQEADLRVVLGHLARGGLDRERFADDQRVALLGVLAHHALVVGVGRRSRRTRTRSRRAPPPPSAPCRCATPTAARPARCRWRRP